MLRLVPYAIQMHRKMWPTKVKFDWSLAEKWPMVNFTLQETGSILRFPKFHKNLLQVRTKDVTNSSKALKFR